MTQVKAADQTALGAIIKQQIAHFGPMRVAEYMALCLLHPDLGYYTTKDPLGAAGDFTTAPEISQMFGEMLGLFLVRCWIDQGRPERFLLVEPGPGRGTLMADILRVAKTAPAFLAAAEVHLIETDGPLRAIQKARLGDMPLRWHDSIETLPDGPLYLIANEFFDALPVRQFARTRDGWRERLVGLKDNTLIFGLGPPVPLPAPQEGVSARSDSVEPGQIVEICPGGSVIMAAIGRRIAAFGGVALVVDYGDWSAIGNSFQAVMAHEKCDPLTHQGAADLTAHVDFAALAQAAGTTKGVAVSPLVAQGALLGRLGIGARAARLAETLEGAALENHVAAFHRLTDPAEMGTLFKALAIYPQAAPTPPGFETDDD